MEILLIIDKAIFSWINIDWANTIFDYILPWITLLGDPINIWLLLFAAVALKIKQYTKGSPSVTPKKFKSKLLFGRILLFSFFLALIYGLNTCTYSLLKYSIDRARPFEQKHVRLLVSRETKSSLLDNGSFPSGHASNIFMAAAIFSAFIPRKRLLFYSLAAVVAFSRVYIGVHFPLDILTGALLGWLITKLMLDFKWLRSRITREEAFIGQTKGEIHAESRILTVCSRFWRY